MFLMRRHLLFIIFCFVTCKSDLQKEKKPIAPALQYLNEAIAAHPFEDSLYYHRGRYAYDQQDYPAALRDLQYAIQLDSLVAPYYHVLADVQMDSGLSYDGLATMIRAATLFPSRIPTLLKLSECLHILKQYDRSLVTTHKVIQLDPVLGEGYFMAALNYRDLKDSAKAIAYLKKATTYDDQMIDGWILLGQLIQPHNSSEAKDYFENAIRLDSTNINTLHSYAEFLQLDDVSKAIRVYHRIMAIDPRYTPSYLNAGVLYFSLDSFQSALDQFTILCSLEPTRAKNYYYRGTTKEALGDLTGARSDYKQGLLLDPSSLELLRAQSSIK